MVGRRKRQTGKRKTLGNHQRSWLWGRNLVLETLRAGRWKPLELFGSDSLDETAREQLIEAAESAGVELQIRSAKRIGELCHARDHQGLLARMPEYPYCSAADILDSANQDSLLLILDSLQDAFNFGAICRTACVFGVDGIFIGSRNQTSVTSHVARSSAGAVNHLEIARVDSLPEIARQFRERNIRVIASSASGSADVSRTELRGGVALVLGSEGSGIQPDLEAECDDRVRIPHAVDFDSLNVAVAAGILLYEVRQRRRSALPED